MSIEVPDLFADHTLVDWHDVAAELGFKAFVALPLETASAVLGAVTFYFASRSAVSAETHNLMRIVADQMAATAEKAQLIDELERRERRAQRDRTRHSSGSSPRSSRRAASRTSFSRTFRTSCARRSRR